MRHLKTWMMTKNHKMILKKTRMMNKWKMKNNIQRKMTTHRKKIAKLIYKRESLKLKKYSWANSHHKTRKA